MSSEPHSELNYSLAFSRVLSQLRNEKHLSQEALSFEAGLDRSFISLLERGLRSPTLDTLICLCRALGITFTQLAMLIEAQLEVRDEP
ncbi:XRE family transcriptional regulator [Pseudomonas sp. 8Z]|uniref:helix-turn-helix domain-containing protein n=1 Tax=Pseudomonas sp. 8Z TaxID=2653166 RepID=UPI0012F1DF71|nr:helix-turn-helix transcriptional regulator [Pseudomonas sp. 8Z]VXC24059.1 XRE family transcriptional regulator [Pseudomonas sp. 8Z]